METLKVLGILTIISTIIVFEIARIWLKCSHRELLEFLIEELKEVGLGGCIAGFLEVVYGLGQLFIGLILLIMIIALIVALIAI